VTGACPSAAAVMPSVSVTLVPPGGGGGARARTSLQGRCDTHHALAPCILAHAPTTDVHAHVGCTGTRNLHDAVWVVPSTAGLRMRCITHATSTWHNSTSAAAQRPQPHLRPSPTATKAMIQQPHTVQQACQQPTSMQHLQLHARQQSPGHTHKKTHAAAPRRRKNRKHHRCCV
jgi:hypothetical protein